MVKEKSIIEKVEDVAKEAVEEVTEAVEEISKEVTKQLTSNDENLEKEAEEESKKTEKAEKKEDKKEDKKAPEGVPSEEGKEKKSLEERKKELLAKAEKLKSKVDATKTEDLTEQIKKKKTGEPLLPLEDYVKSGIYLGTRVVTPDMKPFVYRRRADGLAIFNTDIIDDKIKEALAFLTSFEPEDTIVVCKREAGWKVVEMFSRLTGIRAFTKKYPAGILTNTDLGDFFEAELALVVDHWLDKNAVTDMRKVNKKVLMICDTNNFSRQADEFLIGNNKSPKSLGLIFYLLTRNYCKAKGIQADIPDIEWWTGERE
jgi:small subunit ribosomal protein S2